MHSCGTKIRLASLPCRFILALPQCFSTWACQAHPIHDAFALFGAPDLQPFCPMTTNHTFFYLP